MKSVMIPFLYSPYVLFSGFISVCIDGAIIWVEVPVPIFYITWVAFISDGDIAGSGKYTFIDGIGAAGNIDIVKSAIFKRTVP